MYIFKRYLYEEAIKVVWSYPGRSDFVTLTYADSQRNVITTEIISVDSPILGVYCIRVVDTDDLQHDVWFREEAIPGRTCNLLYMGTASIEGVTHYCFRYLEGFHATGSVFAFSDLTLLHPCPPSDSAKEFESVPRCPDID